jgi:hypothetical protein
MDLAAVEMKASKKHECITRVKIVNPHGKKEFTYIGLLLGSCYIRF